MKPIIERIDLKESQTSFRYFKLKEQQFKPFWHYHPELELTLITKGSGTRFVGNSILNYTENDLVLLGSNLPHNYISHLNNPSMTQEAIVIQFPAHLFDSFIECEAFKTLYSSATRGIQFLHPAPQLLEQLCSFDDLSKTGQLAALIEIIQQLLLHEDTVYLSSSSYLPQMVTDKSKSKIKVITSYILENLTSKLTVNLMAEKAHMIAPSFCRWFKKSTGHSFVTFLNLSRIELACMHLSTTDKPIQAIAFDCGFESLSHFNRTFKKLKGLSPREFRNSMLSH
ncbi:AraC-type DNA-binding protein [Maribacter sedimenticola]|uniref:AraC-type DNA-binding protein n=1 Tax=Maribacter sedimenticola TaxID=228956 RepID=A0ABY1SH66_9FLAO|nr:AraC family transcriptional regulator [Maribacter sedimenticola]SNR46359.1 AraC-type DNA-binding protein [Maribacter sedimenticola]